MRTKKLTAVLLKLVTEWFNQPSEEENLTAWLTTRNAMGLVSNKGLLELSQLDTYAFLAFKRTWGLETLEDFKSLKIGSYWLHLP